MSLADRRNAARGRGPAYLWAGAIVLVAVFVVVVTVILRSKDKPVAKSNNRNLDAARPSPAANASQPFDANKKRRRSTNRLASKDATPMAFDADPERSQRQPESQQANTPPRLPVESSFPQLPVFDTELKDGAPAIAPAVVDKEHLPALVREPVDRFAGLPDADCPVCRGWGTLPTKPPSQFVLYGVKAPTVPEKLVNRRYCEKCQADQDPKQLTREAVERLPTVAGRQEYWEAMAGTPLQVAQTPHVTIFSQLNDGETRQIAEAVARASAHLQAVTGTLELTRTNPDDCEILVMSTQQNYKTLIDKLDETNALGAQNWELARQMNGFAYGSKLAFCYRSPMPTPQFVVNQAAMLMIQRATNQRAEDWLYVGFAGFCENAVFKTNVVTWHQYRVEDLNIGPNWRLALRQLLANRRVRAWHEMFSIRLQNYFAAEQITAFGMATFLVESNPKAFLDFVKQVATGAKTADALALANGKDVDALEKEWLAWINRQR